MSTSSRTATRRSAADFFPRGCDPSAPAGCSLDAVRSAAEHCRGCDIYLRATQTVFGEGDPNARLMLVGEQPGDAEDIEGHPFVGPAGGLLDESLDEAGLEREHVWLTNAVKHFKWAEERGKRRIHDKPTVVEVHACKPWLDAEIAIVEPEVVVALGATAAPSLLGTKFRITKARGEWQQADGRKVLATWHPSAVLRAPEREDRHRMRAELVSDLRQVAESLR